MKSLTLGSLFSGSGGFELGALLAGIKPVWNSEIEPFPIRVTTKRLPNVRHYGDVSLLNGVELEPVDIITFGSPCQDMSVAGKRSGLDGERSGLFYEAIRIVKEMRCATNGEYPRYIVWENVPGAFSSNKGEDFRAVLEAVCSVKDESVSVPEPPKGKWSGAGNIMVDGFSVAWRTLDAQFWGVPQRRKRIYLVADFDGECAGNILFKSEGVSGYSAESFRAWQRATGSVEDCAGAAGNVCLNDGARMDISEEVAGTLRAETHGHLPCVIGPAGNNQPFVVEAFGVCSKSSNAMMSDNPHSGFYEANTSRTLDENGGNPSCNQGGIVVVEGNGSRPSHFGDGYTNSDVMYTLNATEHHGVAYDRKVRRLIPTECARLQGFPDWWCSDLGTENPTEDDLIFWREVFETHRMVLGTSAKPKSDKQIIKWLKNPHTDSAEYKMWGNGVALSCVYFVLSGIVAFS